MEGRRTGLSNHLVIHENYNKTCVVFARLRNKIGEIYRDQRQGKVGYCGNNCHLCAARSENPAVRQKLVEGWRKLFGLEMYTAENVKCDGCPSDGKVADTQCKARPCVKQKGLKSCAYCDEFPCLKLKPLIRPIFFATEDEYNLCMRQFDSAPNLVKVLVERGKPPFFDMQPIRLRQKPSDSKSKKK